MVLRRELLGLAASGVDDADRVVGEVGQLDDACPPGRTSPVRWKPCTRSWRPRAWASRHAGRQRRWSREHRSDGPGRPQTHPRAERRCTMANAPRSPTACRSPSTGCLSSPPSSGRRQTPSPSRVANGPYAFAAGVIASIEHGVDHRGGPAGQQRARPQGRVAGSAVITPLLRVAGAEGGGVGERQHGPVDHGQQQTAPPHGVRSGGGGRTAEQVEQRPQRAGPSRWPGVTPLEVGSARASPARPAVNYRQRSASTERRCH
jgi:hypothetical protein